MSDNGLLIQLTDQTPTEISQTSELENHLQDGVRAHRAGDLKEALLAYRKVLDIDPNHADGNHLFGCTAFQLGELEMAHELIGKAIGKSPENAMFHCNLGIVLQALERPDEAIANHQKALSIRPDLSKSHNALGNLLQQQGRLEDALTCFDKAVIGNPDCATAYTNRGALLRKLGRMEESAENFRKALIINPSNADARANFENSLMERAVSRPGKGPASDPAMYGQTQFCNLLISTIPRSGTNYMQNLFHTLAAYTAPKARTIPVQRIFPAPVVAPYPNIGIGLFGVGHISCPRIEETLQGRQLEQWRQLRFYNDGYDVLGATIEDNPNMKTLHDDLGGFDFANENTRIVFIYRNPLDQFVSYYNHMENHVDETTRGYQDQNGKFHFFEDLNDFIFNGALDSYLKMYASFAWSMPKYGNQIKMIPYETVKNDPHSAMCEILYFIDSATDPSLIPDDLDLAIACCAPAVLKQAEKNAGITLARDQKWTEAPNSHIRDGGSGTWHGLIDRDAVRKIEHRFNDFDFTLKDFEIDTSLDESLSN